MSSSKFIWPTSLRVFHSTLGVKCWDESFHLEKVYLPLQLTYEVSRGRRIVQSFFATPWTAACQIALSSTISWSSLRLMSTELVMPSHHLILCCPLLLLPSIFPSIRVFSSELALGIRWPKYWSLRFSISPSSENSGLISFKMDWFDLWRTMTLWK